MLLIMAVIIVIIFRCGQWAFLGCSMMAWFLRNRLVARCFVLFPCPLDPRWNTFESSGSE